MAKADGSVIIDTKIDTKGMGKGVTDLGNQFKGLGSTVRKLGITIGSVFAVRELVRFGKESVKLGSDLQEVQNVVDVTFTTLNDHVNEFAKAAAKTAGLSETMAKRYVGTFGAMAKSFRFTEAEAYTMSTTLTQLAGDVASFYNISQDEAYTNLKSVFTGETESLKDLGVVMTQAALDDFALRQGINMTTREMTEQQKVALRYQFVLEQLAGASGDFLRTSGSWANQTRLLSLQFQQLKATVGQGFINALTPVIQVINNILAKLQVLAQAFRQLTAALFGDASAGASGATGGVSGLGDAYNDAAIGAENLAGGIEDVGSAAKKASKQLYKFDELNTLSSPDAGGGGGGGAGGAAGGGSFDFGLGDVKPPDVTGTIFDPDKIQRVADIIRTIAGYIPVIATGLLGFKLGRFISDLTTANIKVDTLKDKILLLGKRIGIVAGVTIAITGVALETKGIISTIRDGLNAINFGEILIGSGLIVSGGALVGKMLGNVIIGAAIGGIVGGVPMFFTGLYDAIVNGLNLLNATLIPIGSTMAGAGIGAIIGMLGGPIGAGIGALIGLAVGALTDLVLLVVQNWDTITTYVSEKLTLIGDWFLTQWERIKGVWTTVSEWFNTNVIDPIVTFFTNMWDRISTKASETWDKIVEFFSPAVDWFTELFDRVYQTIEDVFYNIGVIADGCWQIIVRVWEIVSDWFDTNVIQPVSDFFSEMWDSISGWASQAWEDIKGVYNTVASWFDKKIIQPVGDFFSDMWDGFKQGASDAWDGVKSVFSTFADWFRGIFEDAWRGIVNVFSIGGDIFVDIKDGVVSAFKTIVNDLIWGINEAISIPFGGINWALRKLKYANILGIQPFSAIREISIPRIPYLAKGAVIPPNAPFMAMLGDQKNGTNIEAPLSTIQEALLNALKQYGGGKQDININFTGDLAQLARVLKPVIDTENRRIGKSLARGW